MTRLFTLMLLLPVAGCAPASLTSGDAICTATQAARAVHAAALAETPDDRAAVSGANLIEIIDAACR
jgi:predicted RNase H-like nuclease